MSIIDRVVKIFSPAVTERKAPNNPGQNSQTAKQNTQNSDRAQISKEASEVTTAPAQQVPNFTESLGAPKPFVQGEP